MLGARVERVSQPAGVICARALQRPATHTYEAAAVPLAKLMWQKCLISAPRGLMRESVVVVVAGYADVWDQRDAGREGYGVVISRALQHHSSFMHTPVFAHIRFYVHICIASKGPRSHTCPWMYADDGDKPLLSFVCAVGQKQARALDEEIRRYFGPVKVMGDHNKWKVWSLCVIGLGRSKVSRGIGLRKPLRLYVQSSCVFESRLWCSQIACY